MGDLINFNKARKAKARAQARVEAQANRASFGRTKAEKKRDETAAARAKALLDGARLEKD